MTTQANTSRLKVERVSKTFIGTKALTDVSLEIKPGEIRALVGENGAGKSTLMNIVGGVLQKDAGSGDILIDGEKTEFKNPTDAISAGVGFVHQELSMFRHLSVAYNIFADRLPMTKWHTIDKKRLEAEAQALLDSFSLPISPATEVGKLSTGNQQIVEIVRAVSLNAKIIIFDEPTSSLSESEVEMLFTIIEKLREKGVSVIYITHKLGEVFRICDTVSVLRDGQMVAEFKIEDTTMQEIVNSMIGREISSYFVEKSSGIGEEFFLVEGFKLNKADSPISFSLKRNSILGFYGLIGAGRSELLRAICGIDPKAQGDIYLNGEKLAIKTYQDSLKNGITYLTEDRKELGIFPSLSVAQNIYVSDMCRQKGVFLSNRAEDKAAQESAKANNIKTSGVTEKIMNLSGGNQQKVILARCLKINPKIVVLDEPTRGIDVNAKAEIHKRIRALGFRTINQCFLRIIVQNRLPFSSNENSTGFVRISICEFFSASSSSVSEIQIFSKRMVFGMRMMRMWSICTSIQVLTAALMASRSQSAVMGTL